MKIRFQALNSCRDTRRAQITLTDGERDAILHVEVSADLLAHEVSIYSTDVAVNETSEPFVRLGDATEYLEQRLDEIVAELGLDVVELAPKVTPVADEARIQVLTAALLARVEREGQAREAADVAKHGAPARFGFHQDRTTAFEHAGRLAAIHNGPKYVHAIEGGFLVSNLADLGAVGAVARVTKCGETVSAAIV